MQLCTFKNKIDSCVASKFKLTWFAANLRRATAVLIGTSHGVYLGNPVASLSASVAASSPCMMWMFNLSNAGMASVNVSTSMKTDGEMFFHPASFLHVSHDLGRVYVRPVASHGVHHIHDSFTCASVRSVGRWNRVSLAFSLFRLYRAA